MLAGRRARRRAATVPHRDVRHLLAPPWLPYRHGLDFLSDLGSALVDQAGDLSAARSARRAASVEATETGPVPAEAENLPEDTGLLARLLASPRAWVFAVLVVAAVVAARGLVGAGMLSGGALLPAPDGASGLVAPLPRLAGTTLGTGSAAPAAPYLLPLAVAGTVLLGKAWLVVDLLFLLAVPLAALGAHRFLRRVTSSGPASLWGAVAYGVLPVVSRGGAAGPARHRRGRRSCCPGWRTRRCSCGPATTEDRRRAGRLAHGAVAGPAHRVRAAGAGCWPWPSACVAWSSRRRPGAAGRAGSAGCWSSRWSPRPCCCCPWSLATWLAPGRRVVAVRGRAAAARG